MWYYWFHSPRGCGISTSEPPLCFSAEASPLVACPPRCPHDPSHLLHHRYRMTHRTLCHVDAEQINRVAGLRQTERIEVSLDMILVTNI